VIIDTHLHLDDKFDGTAQGAAQELDSQLADAGVARAIVLQLEAQPWSAEEVSEAISMYPRLRSFINVHPNRGEPERFLREGIENLGYIGLKLHPRLQEFGVDDERTVRLVQAAGEMNIPVLIDAFPDGTHLMQGFSPLKYASLARQCPKTRIIWAHMGGHYVIDFMMLAKRLPNVYFDLSYSLLYYQTSSIPGDMIFAMRSMKFDRVFYGSDYPDRSIVVSLELSRQFMRSQGLTEENMAKIMGRNAREFFGWVDL
jgi:predicted TIM-barrel fold metal-dependent hydrolase